MRFTALLIISLVILVIPIAKADGFAIYWDRSYVALHGENTQIAAINYEDGKEKVLLAVKLEQLTDDSVVWIVPVPANASDVGINIFEEFPSFSGSDILLRAEDSKEVLDQIPIMSSFISMPFTILPFGFYWTMYQLAGESKGVQIYETVEKEGIVTQVLTAENSDALYDYLAGKNITISKGSLPIIEDYIGQAYAFVVSWVKSVGAEKYRTLGSESGWVPVKDIETPKAENFVDDMWIEKLEKPPADVQKAFNTLEITKFINQNGLFVTILWLALASLISGFLAGFILFRGGIKFALLGLSNCLSIFALIIVSLLVAKKGERYASLKFIGLFVVLFLIINFLVLPPMIKYLVF